MITDSWLKTMYVVWASSFESFKVKASIDEVPQVIRDPKAIGISGLMLLSREFVQRSESINFIFKAEENLEKLRAKQLK